MYLPYPWQKRYQTGDQPINRAAFDGMVSRAKVETEQQRDLAARAERALITGLHPLFGLFVS